MTVGERLREARERQKVSLHAIAEKTNISVRFLDAIEKNQFEKLPGGIFLRGFIRSYAIQVGLDPDATVAQFLADEPSFREETDDGPVRRGDGPGVGLLIVGGLIVIAATLGLVYLFAPDWLGFRSAAPAPAAVITDTTATDTGSESTPPVSPAAEAVTPATTTVATVPASPAVAEPAEPSAPPAPASPLRLVIAPSARCWVQVTADGQVRVAREFAAGERMSVEASESLRITAGNAGAFAYELNGRPGRALGSAGQVARATIVPATVGQFQTP
ncbi:MAG TPA: RodZ domain-containing protein [Luteitalea sp.]|nr:RodZ domain-containing protein [Luteitalea sp.]